LIASESKTQTDSLSPKVQKGSVIFWNRRAQPWGPLYPGEGTSSARPFRSEKCPNDGSHFDFVWWWDAFQCTNRGDFIGAWGCGSQMPAFSGSWD